MNEKLFTPLTIGSLTLKNRIVMAPMTRNRAKEGNVPGEMVRQYYEQRASAGLIITEGAQISRQGTGYIHTPGIHTQQQIAGWQKVTETVHRAGGKIFLQLWHVGRVSHPDFHQGASPVAPSAINAGGETYTYEGRKVLLTPRALETEEIRGIVEDYRQAAKNAKEAGFDGVEIHGANGYLPDQFLQDGSNKRTDAYGGSVENRARFLLEITDAVLGVWEKERVGLRLSPYNPFNGMHDTDPETTFGYATEQLNQRKIGYLHLVSPTDKEKAGIIPYLREKFKGIFMVNGGYNKATASEAIQSGAADLVSFGVLFIANPDLPKRFRLDAALNEADQKTFYGGNAEGYTDYPALQEDKVLS